MRLFCLDAMWVKRLSCVQSAEEACVALVKAEEAAKTAAATVAKVHAPRISALVEKFGAMQLNKRILHAEICFQVFSECCFASAAEKPQLFVGARRTCLYGVHTQTLRSASCVHFWERCSVLGVRQYSDVFVTQAARAYFQDYPSFSIVDGFVGHPGRLTPPFAQ